MDVLTLYDGFIGCWEAEARAFLPDGTIRRHHWRMRFGRARRLSNSGHLDHATA